MNHSEVTQTLRRTVNTKLTIEIKVQHKCCTITSFIMTSLLLNNRLLTIYSIVKDKTICESSIEKVTVIKAETQITYQSQRK